MTPPSSRVAAQFNEIVGIITNVERNHCTLAHFATPEQKRGRAAFLYKQAASVFDKLKRDMSSEEKARWRALQNRVDLLKDDSAVDYANASDELWRFTVDHGPASATSDGNASPTAALVLLSPTAPPYAAGLFTAVGTHLGALAITNMVSHFDCTVLLIVNRVGSSGGAPALT
ncbi:hypothetical protein EVJ58_g4352 [Rhodofomes roseus]|uniref:Uncharacterized protein n=1 Tax=Rhodofomes roseus TaxID=34475 RepID=A0A4Y9YHT2_9APHY|nr:hypothetical protein EVJ58_g4352 [Rhodofomes roseus]